jgi:AcrR family transcriptional regulator
MTLPDALMQHNRKMIHRRVAGALVIPEQRLRLPVLDRGRSLRILSRRVDRRYGAVNSPSSPPPPARKANQRGNDRIVDRAAQWVHDGRRLDMQGLADELGISRATLFRNAGGREALLSSALWVLTERSLEAAIKRWERQRPPGEMHTPGAGRCLNKIVSKSAGLRRLLDDEPALAIRVLTDPRGQIQTGVVKHVAALLRQDMDEFGFIPLIEPDALAYALVRLGESFIYADVLAARQPDVDTANRLQQALVEATRG